MTQKQEMQIAAMKAQTIGVEVEMNNITRKNAAKAAAAVSSSTWTISALIVGGVI